MAEETLTDLDVQILSHFRRDRLCGKCNGPIEADRRHTCWKCDIKAHAGTQLQWMETGLMNLAFKLGVRQPPSPVRVQPTPELPSPEPPTPIKKPKRKKRKKPQ